MNEEEAIFSDITDIDIVDSLELEDLQIKRITIIFLSISILLSILNYIFENAYNSLFTIPFLSMVAVYIRIIKHLSLEVNKKAYYYLIPIILILISNIIINVDITNLVLNVFIIPVLLSIFFMTFINKNYSITRKILIWFKSLFPKNLFHNLLYFKILFKKNTKEKNDKLKNIIIGIIVAIPLVFILLELLTDGDKYFNAFIEKIISFGTKTFDFSTISGIIIYAVAFFIILFSVFINIILNKDKTIEESKKKNINEYISYTILLIVNFVFFLFIVSEISKLTTNFLNIPLEYTYAEYAREGFFQLLAVSSINFLILSFYLYYTDSLENTKGIKKLLFLLIIFSIFLIGNSFYRMILYIEAYGFTVLRLQVILFLTMEFLLFFLFLIKLFRKVIYKEIDIFTIIILATYIINLYLCNEKFIKFINF